MELHLYYSAFPTSGHSKCFTMLPNIHPFTHRRPSHPLKATASSSGAVRERCLAQSHLDTRLGGAGDRTGNLQVTDSRALPPELRRPKQQHLGPNIQTITHGWSDKVFLKRFSPCTSSSREIRLVSA